MASKTVLEPPGDVMLADVQQNSFGILQEMCKGNWLVFGVGPFGGWGVPGVECGGRGPTLKGTYLYNSRLLLSICVGPPKGWATTPTFHPRDPPSTKGTHTKNQLISLTHLLEDPKTVLLAIGQHPSLDFSNSVQGFFFVKSTRTNSKPLCFPEYLFCMKKTRISTLLLLRCHIYQRLFSCNLSFNQWTLA